MTRSLLASLLLVACAACTNSGDFESYCSVRCRLPDGGALHMDYLRIACCGVHDNPTHSGEEGSDCTMDWVSSHTRQFCQTPVTSWYAPDGGSVAYDCPASAYSCSCTAPETYPSLDGCD
jgi:hypothetical protein